MRSVPLDAATIKAIIQALTVNGSKTARQTLSEVLQGTFKSDDDRTATEGLLETLVLMPSPEHEETLFRVLTNPELVRPTPADQSQPGRTATGQVPGYPAMPGGPQGAYGARPPGYSPPPGSSSGYAGPSGSSPGYQGPYGPSYGGYPRPGQGYQGKMTGAEMQSKALALVGQFGSEAFRIKLASHVASPSTSAEARQVIFPTLASVQPQNVAAQSILYRSESLDKGDRALLEGYLVKYSSAALAMLMKVPEESASRRTSETTPRTPYGPYGPGSVPGSNPMLRGPNLPGGMGPPGGTRPPGGVQPPGTGFNMPSGPPARSRDVSMGRSPDGVAMFAVQAPRNDDMRPGGSPAVTPPGGKPYPGPTTFPPGGPSRPAGMPGMRPTGPPGYPYPGQPSSGAWYSAAAGINGPLSEVPGFSREAICGLAAPLWTSEFTKVLETRLDGLESLDSDAGTVVLASTIPTDAMRTKLYRLLEGHFDHGSRGLDAAGLAGDSLSNPGLLVTMKLLPRKDTKSRKPSVPNLSRLRERRGNQGGNPSGGPSYPGGSSYPGGPRGGQYPPSGQSSEQPQQATPAEEWMATAERLVRAVSERLATAGRAGRDSSTVAEKRPVEVQGGSDMRIVSEYHFEWPEDLANKDKLSGVSLDPMTIHYVRFQRKSTIGSVTSFYRRKLVRPVEHSVATGTWIESLRTVTETGRRFSVDVLITREADMTRAADTGRGTAGPGYGAPGYGPPGSGPPGAGPRPPAYGPGARPGDSDSSRRGGQPNARPEREKNEPADLVVEVLAIEINDPAKSEEEAQPAAEEPKAATEAAKEKP